EGADLPGAARQAAGRRAHGLARGGGPLRRRGVAPVDRRRDQRRVPARGPRVQEGGQGRREGDQVNDGTTTERPEHSQGGTYTVEGQEFVRDSNYISTRVTRDGADGYPVEAGRYRLVAARACPWANRSIIVRRLLGLEDAISLGLPGPTHDERSWTFDLDPGGKDPVLGIERLQEAFFARDPDYPRGITVPAIVDTRDGAVVTNDYPQITLDLSTEWAEHHREGAPRLLPEDPAERAEMDAVMRRVYTEVNNGVYRCGFAGSQ